MEITSKTPNNSSSFLSNLTKSVEQTNNPNNQIDISKIFTNSSIISMIPSSSSELNILELNKESPLNNNKKLQQNKLSEQINGKRNFAQLAKEKIEPYVRKRHNSGSSSERSRKRLNNLNEEEQNILRTNINSRERKRMHVFTSNQQQQQTNFNNNLLIQPQQPSISLQRPLQQNLLFQPLFFQNCPQLNETLNNKIEELPNSSQNGRRKYQKKNQGQLKNSQESSNINEEANHQLITTNHFVENFASVQQLLAFGIQTNRFPLPIFQDQHTQNCTLLIPTSKSLPPFAASTSNDNFFEGEKCTENNDKSNDEIAPDD
uniref:Uncharacterized protein n=1 Tax=Meloidogyne floridensis TaxID=298350 RepID=A0A915PAQ1_9BILA